MKGNARPRRRPKSRRNLFFLAAFSFYFFRTWSLHRHVGIGSRNDVKQYGTTGNAFFLSSDHVQKDFCDNINASSNGDGVVDESVYRHWKYIDDTTNRDFPKARVSGGIFLYPRQASILTHLIHRVHAVFRDDRKTITICETGYGSGHSMALFASASVGPVRVVSFDKFDRPYQLPIWHRLNETMSLPRSSSELQGDQKKSFDFFKGNSCKTVPSHLPSLQCDVLHGSSLCPTDNIDLVENSPCGVLLTSTAMGSLNDRQVYFGKNAQWRKLRERQCISNIVCFKEDGALDIKRDFVFAKEGSSQTGEFCVAVTTGRCQRGKTLSGISDRCAFAIDRLLTQLGLNETCPKHQIQTPT